MPTKGGGLACHDSCCCCFCHVPCLPACLVCTFVSASAKAATQHPRSPSPLILILSTCTSSRLSLPQHTFGLWRKVRFAAWSGGGSCSASASPAKPRSRSPHVWRLHWPTDDWSTPWIFYGITGLVGEVLHYHQGESHMLPHFVVVVIHTRICKRNSCLSPSLNTHFQFNFGEKVGFAALIWRWVQCLTILQHPTSVSTRLIWSIELLNG